MTKTHDRDYFYKYVTANVAKLILRNRTVRWASPLKFNDPFDTQINLNFVPDLDEFPSAFRTEYEAMIYGEAEPPFDTRHQPGSMSFAMARTIRMLRQLRHTIPRAKILGEDLQKALEQGVSNLRRASDAWRRWWRKYLRDMRVFCVAEEPDNLLMWAHYADSHEGAVIKFKCLPEFDTPLCAAKPINYREDVPVLYTLDDYIKKYTGQKWVDRPDLLTDLAFTKSAHWGYEKEWRLWLDRPYVAGDLEEFVAVLPQEIDGIYLGCKISPEDRLEIMSLLVGDLAHVEVYQARRHSRRFEIEFHRLDRLG